MVKKFDKQLFRHDLNYFIDEEILRGVSCDSVDEIVDKINVFIKRYDFDVCLYDLPDEDKRGN